jgi:hypothetical protein
MMQTDYQKEWEQILSASNLHQSLLKHFKKITSSDETLALLQLVTAGVKEASVQNEKLVITFKNGNVLQCAAPDKSMAYTNWPADFQNIISIHKKLEFGSSDMSIARDYFLGDHGTFIIENDDYENCESPMIDDSSNWWIYVNRTGDLLLVSHEDEEIVERSSQSIWYIFLQRIAKSLKVISNPSPVAEKKELRKSSASVKELKSEAKTLKGVKRVIDNGRILNIGGQFALMEWRDKKLEVLSTTSFNHHLIPSQLVQFQIIDSTRIFMGIEEKTCHFANVNDSQINISPDISIHGNKAPCLVDDRIYFYKKGYPEGFSRMSINDITNKETFQNKPPTGIVNFTRSFEIGGVVLFAGTRLIGFNVSAEKPVELFNVDSQITQPSMAPLRYPLVLLYETFYNDSKLPAIVILDITSGKIVASYRPGEFVQAIDCTQKEVVFLTKRKNQHFLLKYDVSGELLELIFEIKLHFDNGDNPVDFVQQVENTLTFIDREGYIFSFEP